MTMAVTTAEVAATPTADGPYLIDADGVLFREEGDRSHPDLPYVTGWDRAPSRGERIGRLRTALAAVVAAEAEGIDRIVRVEVGIAPEDLLGIFRQLDRGFGIGQLARGG